MVNDLSMARETLPFSFLALGQMRFRSSKQRWSLRSLGRSTRVDTVNMSKRNFSLVSRNPRSTVGPTLSTRHK